MVTNVWCAKVDFLRMRQRSSTTKNSIWISVTFVMCANYTFNTVPIWNYITQRVLQNRMHRKHLNLHTQPSTGVTMKIVVTHIRLPKKRKRKLYSKTLRCHINEMWWKRSKKIIAWYAKSISAISLRSLIISKRNIKQHYLCVVNAINHTCRKHHCIPIKKWNTPAKRWVEWLIKVFVCEFWNEKCPNLFAEFDAKQRKRTDHNSRKRNNNASMQSANN